MEQIWYMRQIYNSAMKHICIFINVHDYLGKIIIIWI